MAWISPPWARFRPGRGGDKQMDEWTDGQMDERTGIPGVIQDFVPFGAAAQRNQKFQFYLNKAGYLNRHQLRVLGRSGNVEGRGSGGSRIHDGISCM